MTMMWVYAVILTLPNLLALMVFLRWAADRTGRWTEDADQAIALTRPIGPEDRPDWPPR